MTESSGSRSGGIVLIAIASVALALGMYRVLVGLMVGDAARQFDALEQEALLLPSKMPTDEKNPELAKKIAKDIHYQVSDRVHRILVLQKAIYRDMERKADFASKIAIVLAVGVFLLATVVYLRQRGPETSLVPAAAEAAEAGGPPAVPSAVEEEPPAEAGEPPQSGGQAEAEGEKAE